jgi:uncharacterized repeat protein (TIGR03803 family)
MTKTNVLAWTGLVFLLCATGAIASQAQTFTTLLNFDGTNGSDSLAGLVQGTDGNLYGTTLLGGQSPFCLTCGTLFRVSKTGNLITHTFCAEVGCTDGRSPYAGLLQATDGNFYGVTSSGGATGYGTVFKMTPAGEFTTLHSFDLRDGATPLVAPIEGTDGNLYGTTVGGRSGGSCACGVFFRITRGGDFTVLHSFDLSTSVANGLVQAGGYFYGTTAAGGTHHSGTVFRITKDGTLTTLRSFCSQRNCADGANPEAPMVLATDGNFYGTTLHGGANKSGTVFKIAGGKLTTLYTFCSLPLCVDGQLPSGTLVQATDGSFYETTSDGGTSNGGGTVFQITPEGTLTTLHNFNLTDDGHAPSGGLLQDTDGKFYGTTAKGGTSGNCPFGCGTVFSLDIGLGPFVSLLRYSGTVGSPMGILGQGFTGTTNVSVNGTAATFTVVSDTYLTAKVPDGATTGFVTVTTPSGTLTSNQVFRVRP